MLSKKSKTSRKSLWESAAYNPSTPLFDTSSDDADDSEFEAPILDIPKKRGRGRPKKNPVTPANDSIKVAKSKSNTDDTVKPDEVVLLPKRGRGRPRKYPRPEPELEPRSHHVPKKGKKPSRAKDRSRDESISPVRSPSPDDSEFEFEADDLQSPDRSPNKNDEFLNARVRIISGRYEGQVGRIGRIIHSGWIYIKGNDEVERPVRWKDVEILDDDQSSDEEVGEKMTVDTKSDTAKCKREGCTKFRTGKCKGYCVKHFKQFREAKKSDQDEDLIGAEIRITDPSHAGLRGTIVEKRSQTYLQIKWHSKNASTETLPLDHVEIKHLPPATAFANPVEKYSGAVVKKDGILGKVESVILGQCYIISDVERAFARDDFVVLKYADGGRLKDDEVDSCSIHGSDGSYKSEEESEFNQNHPLIGVTVLVHYGQYQGKMGKIVRVHERGRWEVEGMGLKVTARGVSFVDTDGDLDVKTIREFFNGLHRKTKMPDVVTLDEINLDEATRPIDESDGEGTGPLLGVTVHVVNGRARGHIGAITKICKGGWWELEGIESRVQAANVNFVDDGNLCIDSIQKYYENSRNGTEMPDVVKMNDIQKELNEVESDQDEGSDESSSEDQSSSDDDNTDQRHPKLRPTSNNRYVTKSFSHKVRSTNFGLSSPSSKNNDLKEGRGTSKEDSIVKWGRKFAVSLVTPSIPNVTAKRPLIPHHLRTRGSSVPVLDPILVQPSTSYFATADKESSNAQQHSFQLVSEELRQLPLDTKIEIFNRRTGRVMRGEEAIVLSDLPAALMDHAEYEPIVPSMFNSALHSISYRTGRSGERIRVGESVVQQEKCRVRASAVEGKQVLVTGGEHRGLIGNIDSAIPGGYYLVSRLFNDDQLDLDVVIKSDHLELIPDKHRSYDGQDVRLKALKLRLDALEEKRTKIVGDKAHSVDVTAEASLRNLDANIEAIKSDIALHSNIQDERQLKQQEPNGGEGHLLRLVTK